MKIRPFLAAFVLLFSVAFCTQTQSQDTGEWINLFNGEDLEGWIQRGGEAEYFVEDGELVGETVPDTPNSFLTTEDQYCDFVLEYEVKVDDALNSGVQIRSHSFADYRDGRVHGYQVEIDPSDRSWSGGIYDEARRGWLNDLEDNEEAREAFNNGEWNHFRVEANSHRIRTWVNGVEAANLEDNMTPCGFIGLQVHSTDETDPLQVRWRDVRIKFLD